MVDGEVVSYQPTTFFRLVLSSCLHAKNKGQHKVDWMECETSQFASSSMHMANRVKKTSHPE